MQSTGIVVRSSETSNSGGILLNGVTFIEAAIKRALDFNDRTIFFDNDEAGEDASRTFLNSYPLTHNSAPNYAGFKDYNQRLVSELDNLYRLPKTKKS